MPATSPKSPQDESRFGADFKPATLVDERGCRRDIRSNGWIVVRGVRSGKTGPAEETGFLRSVRICGPQFHRSANRTVKSAPDVFADALVSQRNRCLAVLLPLPSHPVCHPRLLGRCCAAAAGMRVPMVIIWRNRRVNRIPGFVANPRRTGTSSMSWLPASISHSPSIHRDT
jgi:hypothetical protein